MIDTDMAVQCSLKEFRLHAETELTQGFNKIKLWYIDHITNES